MKRIFLTLLSLGFPLVVHAQSPQITSINRCINSNPDCNGVVNNPGEIAIRWTTDPSSGSSDPVTRVYLHGPFNTVEGATPADPGHPDALCAGIGQGWDDTWHVWRDVDGTLCNFDDGTCLLPTPADGSSDPLSGMREPHCRLNICGNGGEGFDREVCNPMPSGAILVDGARESGSYFLVFEKESGAVEIATRHYDPLPPSCGEVTASFSAARPEVTFTLNPTDTTHIILPSGCSGPTQITGPGSENYTCPINGREHEFDFTCQGEAGSVTRRFQVQLGPVTPSIDCPGSDCTSEQSPTNVTLTYGATRSGQVVDLDVELLNFWQEIGWLMGGQKGAAPTWIDPTVRTPATSLPWVGFLMLSSVDDVRGFETIVDFQWAPTAAKTAHASRDYAHFKYKVTCIDFDGSSCGTQTVQKPYSASYVHALQDNQLPPPSRRGERRHATQTYCEASWSWNDSCDCDNPWDNGIFGGCENKNDGHWSFPGGPESHHRFIQIVEGLNVKDHINVFCSRDQSRYSQKLNDYNILAQHIEDQLQGLKGYGLHQVTVDVNSIRETFWCGGSYRDYQDVTHDFAATSHPSFFFSTCDPSSVNYFSKYGDQEGGCSIGDVFSSLAGDVVAVGSALGVAAGSYYYAWQMHSCIATHTHCPY